MPSQSGVTTFWKVQSSTNHIPSVSFHFAGMQTGIADRRNSGAAGQLLRNEIGGNRFAELTVEALSSICVRRFESLVR